MLDRKKRQTAELVSQRPGLKKNVAKNAAELPGRAMRSSGGATVLARLQPPNELEEKENLFRDPQRSLPPWLVSLILHVSLILLLALIPFYEQIESGISLTGIFGNQEGEMSFDVTNESTESIAIVLNETVSNDLAKTISTDNQIEIKIDTPLTTSTLPGMETPVMAMGLSGRTGSMKSSLLKAYGGTEGTENAVELGLKWLAKQQRADGSWSLLGPYSSPGISENKSAATAMAMLAFLGAGHTHREGTYKQNVDRGLYYLLQIQNARGFFADKAPDRQQMYAQAQCTIVLCELYGMTKDEKFN